MTKFFINCDWGTTHFRLRLVAAESCQIAAEFRSDDGVARLNQGSDGQHRAMAFRAVLETGLRQLGERAEQSLEGASIVISGMASSSIGWQELPYALVPWRLDGSDTVWRELDPVTGTNGSHRTILLSGVRTSSDVMRGEETEALGVFQSVTVAGAGASEAFVSRSLAEGSIVVVPGTHSKHLFIENRRLVDFRTFMTGELYEILSLHSVLRHSVLHHGLGVEPGRTDDPFAKHEESFLAGVRQACETPVTAALFRVRTRQVLDALPREANRAFLSGVLIGGELLYLAHQEPREIPVVLCAVEPLARRYALALDGLGLSRRLISIPATEVERLSALGQAQLARRLGLV